MHHYCSLNNLSHQDCLIQFRDAPAENPVKMKGFFFWINKIKYAEKKVHFCDFKQNLDLGASIFFNSPHRNK